MKIKRTANAGVLLELDGQRILLDGVCGQVPPYEATPPALKMALRSSWPDGVAFTHEHTDHFDIDYAQDYHTKTLRPILGPESLPVETCGELVLGTVRLRRLDNRHLGRAGQTEHASILAEGSKTVLFTGDAAPSVWRKSEQRLRPDVLICPYAYATTAGSWQIVKELAPTTVVLVHFPPQGQDEHGLWEAALSTVRSDPAGTVYIPAIGETVMG